VHPPPPHPTHHRPHRRHPQPLSPRLTCTIAPPQPTRTRQLLVYFAVAKQGDTPTDGKTDVNPEGLTAAYGPHAQVKISNR